MDSIMWWKIKNKELRFAALCLNEMRTAVLNGNLPHLANDIKVFQELVEKTEDPFFKSKIAEFSRILTEMIEFETDNGVGSCLQINTPARNNHFNSEFWKYDVLADLKFENARKAGYLSPDIELNFSTYVAHI